jgi:UPF0042 nucleotide-binding protein
MRLIIVSGQSGSGKSIALRTLEDFGFYCIDNLPLYLLRGFARHLIGAEDDRDRNTAVGIDARSRAEDLMSFAETLGNLKEARIDCEIVFLRSSTEVLLNRFSETRRKHPLTNGDVPLAKAIERERELLQPISRHADLFVDTTRTNVHELRELIRARVADRSQHKLSLLFESFGYKNGTPNDADFVFDVRCLPNPHWEPRLRQRTGHDPEVIEFLEQHPAVHQMFNALNGFLKTWIPFFESENRSYLTVAIGCTGGQHRSVYIAEHLSREFAAERDNVLTRHRDLS